MDKARRYTSLLLLVIFTFPVIFQAGHILQHQHEEHHCDAVGNSCTSINRAEKKIAGQSFSEQGEKSGCPVCDYEFVVFFFVAKKKLPQIEHPATILASGLLSLHPFCFSGSNRSLRAPPAA